MIRVPNWFYLLLWITMLVFGLLLFIGGGFQFIEMQRPNGTIHAVSDNALPVAGVSAALGAAMCIYALRRLLRPLKPPPPPADGFD